MTPKTTQYARFTDRSWSMSEKDFEIQTEQDAVQRGLVNRAVLFETYEIVSVDIGGQILKGDPQNFSARRYVGIDRVYTQAEMVAEMQNAPAPGTQGMTASFKATFQTLARDAKKATIDYILQKDAPDTMYITGLERPGEFIGLKSGEKVFDRSGKQLFPAAAAPAPAKKLAP